MSIQISNDKQNLNPTANVEMPQKEENISTTVSFCDICFQHFFFNFKISFLTFSTFHFSLFNFYFNPLGFINNTYTIR